MITEQTKRNAQIGDSIPRTRQDKTSREAKNGEDEGIDWRTLNQSQYVSRLKVWLLTRALLPISHKPPFTGKIHSALLLLPYSFRSNTTPRILPYNLVNPTRQPEVLLLP